MMRVYKGSYILTMLHWNTYYSFTTKMVNRYLIINLINIRRYPSQDIQYTNAPMSVSEKMLSSGFIIFFIYYREDEKE